MKKFLSLLLAISLTLALMANSVLAVGDTGPWATVTGASGTNVATGAPGETVTFTVALHDVMPATTVGVSVTGLSYDYKHANSKWQISGLIQDVNSDGAVWAYSEAMDINGDVLTLAFTVPTPEAGQTDFTYEFSCEIYVSDNVDVLTLHANGAVTVVIPATGLTLDEETLSLDLKNGAQETLTATVTPANTTEKVTWTSSDATVATVNNGTVTGLKAGAATITATVGSLTKTCAVEVFCSHDLEETPAKAPTCLEEGNNQYYTCKVCSAVLKADQITPTTKEEETLGVVDHTYADTYSSNADQHWFACTTPNCQAAKDKADHTFTWKVDKEATEDEEGLKHEECQTCGYKRNENTVIDKLPHAHIGVQHHEAVAATCVATGNVEYWTCSSPKCDGKFYGDAQCTTELEEVELSIDSESHGETELRNDKAPTCYQDGYSGDIYCKRCNQPTKMGEVMLATGNHVAGDTWYHDETNHWYKCTTEGCLAELNKAAHTFDWVVDQAATEDATGLKHEECECGLKRNEGTVIEKLDHVHIGIQHHDAVAATCIDTGTVEYWTCSSPKCAGKYYGDEACQTELTTIVAPIDSTNHGQTELKDDKAPTCYQPGYTGDTYCKLCGAITVYGEVIGATNDHIADEFWYSDDTHHWHLCTTTGCTEILGKVGHTFSWIEDKAATEDEEGLKHEQCQCGVKRNENTVIEKLPHRHIEIRKHNAVAATCVATGNVEYWTCGSDKCADIYYGDAQCATVLESVTTAINPDNHLNTETVGAVQPNCYQFGYSGDLYCNDCEKVVDPGVALNPTGNHVAGNVWHSDDTNHWHVCTTEGCEAIVDKAKHSFSWVVDKAATEDETGLKHEQCQCGFKRSENTVIEKLDHTHVGIAHHDAVAATCAAAGNVEYWTCSSAKCAGKYYGDAACQLQLETIVVAINPNNHGVTEVKGAVAPTCAVEGYTGDTYCTVCNALVANGQKIEATGEHTAKDGYLTDESGHWQVCVNCEAVMDTTKASHAFVWIIDKKPTEAATGLKHEACSVCNYTRNAETVVEKLKHAPYLVEAKEATCTEDGRTDYYYCGSCGCYYASEDGKIGQMISYADTVVAATGHDEATEWLTDAENHWHECQCGEISDKAAHTLETVGAVEATETEVGYTGDSVCSVCEYVAEEGEEIPCVPAEEPVEEEIAAPEESEPQDPADVVTGETDSEAPAKGGFWWIIPAIIILVAGWILFLILGKKNKKQRRTPKW